MGDCVFVSAPICDSAGSNLVPALQDSYNECPQLGVVTLASILRANGHSCDLFDWVTQADFEVEKAARVLSRYSLVFASANSMNWAAVLRLLSQLKRVSPATVTCVGGPHSTLHAQSLVGRPEIDIFVVGEADRIICHIADCVLGGRLADIRDGQNAAHIGVNLQVSEGLAPMSGLIPCQENLRSLPHIPVEYGLYTVEDYCVLPVETSRGCKFRCEFCSIPTKSYWRDYSVEQAVQQMEHALPYAVRTKAGILSIIDDTFTTSEERVVQIAKKLDSRFFGRVNFDATVVDIRKEAVVDAMSDFASGLLVGAEVSSKSEAKRIQKAATPKLIEDSASVLLRYGIASKAVYSFIIGFPWHTYEDCMRTLDFAANLILDYGVTVYLQWYWPIPGSEIWRGLEREGLVNMEIVDQPAFFRSHQWFYNTRALNEEEIRSVDEKVLLVQSVINVGGDPKLRSPLNYTSPFLYAGTLRHMRNPQHAEFLVS